MWLAAETEPVGGRVTTGAGAGRVKVAPANLGFPIVWESAIHAGGRATGGKGQTKHAL